MKALSIRQPWAWAILNAGKRIENRDWRGPPSYRGPLLIHAAKGCTRDEYEEGLVSIFVTLRALGKASGPLSNAASIGAPSLAAMQRGGIVGTCDLVDVINRGAYVSRCYPANEAHRIESPWYMGSIGLVLDNVRPLPFVPFAGALGFFDVPDLLVPGALP